MRRILAAGLAAIALLSGGVLASAEATATPLSATATDAPYNFNGIVRDGQTPIEGVKISVQGNGVDETVTTGTDGRWLIGLQSLGTYTVSIDLATLPDGLKLKNPSFESRQVEAASTANGVLFPLVASSDGGPGGPDPSASALPTEGETPPPTSGDPGGTAPGPATSDFGAQVATRVITGLGFGLLLALAAIGITLIFGTTGVNNFAHGELLTFGGLMFYATTTLVGLPLIVSILLTLLASAAFGWFHDAAIFRPLRARRVGLVQVLIVTIGLSIALRYFYQFLIGGSTEQLDVSRGAIVQVGPVPMTMSNVVTSLVSVVVLVAVGLFLTKTRIGKATRAVSDNSSLAAASGINVDRVIRIVWVLAGVLTGLAGVLYTYFIGGNIKWDVGFTVLLLLFAAVTLGGLGSAFGALVGALVIGLATELATLVLPGDVRYAVALAILVLVLLVRPQGILGSRERIG